VDSKSGKTFETINPANGKVITRVAAANAVSRKKNISQTYKLISLFNARVFRPMSTQPLKLLRTLLN
jgi:hypothetical protein